MNQFVPSSLRRPGVVLLSLIAILALGWAHRTYFAFEGPEETIADARRTVVVHRTDKPSQPDELHGTLVKGTLPAGEHEAEVLSDRNCAPDSEGISHCLNELALGKKHITIRHHHRMSEVPCLRPGEMVTVMDRETYAERSAS